MTDTITHQVEPYTVAISGFQNDVGDWSARNFGWRGDIHRQSVDPLFGAAEEVGELAAAHAASKDASAMETSDRILLSLIDGVGKLVHAHLKMKQGIRGSREEHRKNAAVAVREIRDLLRSFSVESSLPMKDPSCLEVAMVEVPDRARIPTDEQTVSDKADAVADVMVYLADYCARNDVDMERAVNFTWGRPISEVTGKGGVRYRDWTHNKTDGGGHGTIETTIPISANETGALS